MSGFGRKRIGRSGNQRACERADVALPANLHTSVHRHPVDLTDVSATGAQVISERVPALGSFVQLQVRGSTVFGTVAWARQGSCGIEFDKALDPATVEMFRTADRKAARLGLSPDDLRALDHWGGNLAD
ncbi:PilZ domain-containing protein [Aurantiacibacter sp. MUD11]|uniref:PilZ domain-containing protein n=1 Tax=Aurantiacibacter sp. MUD11 TaxID=3003265 RepID=UPI0022AAF218|nr:PilZ domain-containing protein [Aurantiacibacter sp. MUD11]WAT17872.1 PilZ domain-containing protein [Aurantiacibacter sp. MUD11]